jgi:hypothetical protein
MLWLLGNPSINGDDKRVGCITIKTMDRHFDSAQQRRNLVESVFCSGIVEPHKKIGISPCGRNDARWSF